MIQQAPYRRWMGAVLVLAVALVAACGDANDPAQGGSASSGAVGRVSKGTASPATPLRSEDAQIPSESVGVDDAVHPFRLEVRAESGYLDADGTLVLDVLEEEPVFPTLSIRDALGRAVRGVRPTVTPSRDSRAIPWTGGAGVSDEWGNFPFGLVGGTMGEERVEIVAGDAVESLILNVISRRAAGYDWLGEIEGVLDWALLFEADVRWDEEGISASFSDEVMAKSGQAVKLAGFMMPLEPTRKQSHFVLTSNPPDCFFHLPGGPAGAVEVFAEKPLEVGWDPVVLEGRFEALESSENGVVYRLHDARAVPTEVRAPAR